MDEARQDLEGLLALCTQDGRVCPLPLKWSRMWKLIVQGGHEKEVPYPLILGGWDASDHQKRGRVGEHLRWGEKLGRLAEVGVYLARLRDKDWCYWEGEGSWVQKSCRQTTERP